MTHPEDTQDSADQDSQRGFMIVVPKDEAPDGLGIRVGKNQRRGGSAAQDMTTLLAELRTHATAADFKNGTLRVELKGNLTLSGEGKLSCWMFHLGASASESHTVTMTLETSL